MEPIDFASEYDVECAANAFVKRQKIIVGSVVYDAELNRK